MNILITGASGPIGKSVIEFYMSRYPLARLYALTRKTNQTVCVPKNEKVVVIPCNLTSTLNEIRNSIKPDALPIFDRVIHVAAAVPRNIKNPIDFYNTNVIGARALFENIQINPSGAVLYFSTSSVYVSNTSHVTEATTLNTTDDYGISKYIFENYLLEKCQTFKATAVNVRVPVLLAPGVRGNFISKWKEDILAHRTIRLFNANRPFNSCVWIDDIFTFFENVALQTKPTQFTCNISAAHPITILAVAKHLANRLGRRLKYHEGLPKGTAQNYDCTLAIKQGYIPRRVTEILDEFAPKNLRSTW